MSPTVDNSLTPQPSVTMTTASPSLLPHHNLETCPHQFQPGAAFRAVIVQSWRGGGGGGDGDSTYFSY